MNCEIDNKSVTINLTWLVDHHETNIINSIIKKEYLKSCN